MTPSMMPGGDYPMTMPSSVNPITADIIASQSQDYVDEGLAEFQEQIQRLQGIKEKWFFLSTAQSLHEGQIELSRTFFLLLR